MRIEDGKLRPIRNNDLKMVLRWRNAKHIRSNMISDRFVALDELQGWYDNLLINEKIGLIFEIGQIPVGLTVFSQIDPKNSTGSCCFFIGKADLPYNCSILQGYVSLCYGFKDLHLRKISTKILASYHSSAAIFLKLGFAQEGCLRKQYYRQERYEDLLILSIFNDKWTKGKNELRRELEGSKNSHRIITKLQQGRSNFKIKP